MKWLAENWSLLVVAACVVVGYAIHLKRFTSMPIEDQLDKVREWLLYAVIEAERLYGSGTGELKLRAVYDEFYTIFPDVAEAVSFETFSRLVDEALEEMRKLLGFNKNIEAYVEGGDL